MFTHVTTTPEPSARATILMTSVTLMSFACFYALFEWSCAVFTSFVLRSLGTVFLGLVYAVHLTVVCSLLMSPEAQVWRLSSDAFIVVICHRN